MSASPEDRPTTDEPGDEVDPGAVASRAGGRPPEEGSSDDPEAQAKAILEESEARVVEGLHASDPVE